MTGFSLIVGSSLPTGWDYTLAGDFRRKRSITFNPAVATDEKYELWSVPSHAYDAPEIVTAGDIGSSKQFVSPGDVLISKINPHLNRTWIVRESRGLAQIASTEWIVFPRSDGIDSRFLATLLSDNRIRDFLSTNASGVGGSLMRARPTLFDKMRIPFPPLNEQRRIVDKIEAMFDEIDKGVESLRAAKSTLDLYRKSLLKAAFEGRLTTDWRARNPDKLESTEDLLARIRQEREGRYQAALEDWREAVNAWQTSDKRGKKPTKPKHRLNVEAKHIPCEAIPASTDAWAFSRLGELNVLVSDGPFGSNLRTRDYTNSGVRVIRLENVGKGKFLDEKRSFISQEKYETIKKHSMVPGTIVVSSFMTEGVRSCFVPESVPISINKADCFAVTVTGKRSNRRFLAYFLLSSQAFEQLEGLVHGVGRPRINTTQLKELHVPVCSPAEQSEVVRILDARLEAVETLRFEIDASHANAEALRQSILKEAFAGRLVPQNPQDEPASDLLARKGASCNLGSTTTPQGPAQQRISATNPP